ncbi:hypothetical protein [Microbacterium sp.]|uniref:hypothetical protein n=1 Tax=Microbacterium sp. TaxID=51671 RepID=UPI0039E5B8E5
MTRPRPRGAGIGSRSARAAIVSTGALFVVNGVMDGSLVPIVPTMVLAFLVVLAGVIVLTTRGGDALSPRRALLVAACALTSAALMLGAVGVPGEVWMFSFSSYLTGLLIVRGNPRTGLASSVALLAIGVGAGLIAHAPASAVVALLTVPTMAVCTGVVWSVALRYLGAREARFRAAAARAALEADIARESLSANERELTGITDLASPLLVTIAEGTTPSERLRPELELVEAAIRDRIRVARLRQSAVEHGVDAARRRGVAVVLIGEPDDPRPVIGAPLASAITEAIADVGEGHITIRCLPPRRGAAVSVLIEDASGPRRLVLAEDGSRAESADRTSGG